MNIQLFNVCLLNYIFDAKHLAAFLDILFYLVAKRYFAKATLLFNEMGKLRFLFNKFKQLNFEHN